MKVSILTLGTRGDVQPYVALGEALINKGHQVVICTGMSFRSLIESHGVSFYPASADLMEILESEEGRAIFSGGAINPIKMMDYAKRIITPAYRKSMEDFYVASKGADIIIFHPKALGACDIADYYGIPAVCMPPVPIIYPITEFPNLAVSPTRNLGAGLNKLSYQVSTLAEGSYIKQINNFREKTLRLPPRKSGAYNKQVGKHSLRIVYPISELLFPEVNSWKGKVDLTGFFYLNEEENRLEAEIEQFLEQGEPPILITFSSMPLKDPDTFQKNLLQALEQAHQRAILLTGASGLKLESNQQILVVKRASHRWLMPRCGGIIHHGGVGTLAEALLSGIPQFIIPFSVDQPFWAHRLNQMGLSLKPLKEKQLTVEQLVSAFREMKDERRIVKAKEFGQKISKEDGLSNAVLLLESIVQ
jgi:sterol 3beta-glucosyltransferase